MKPQCPPPLSANGDIGAVDWRGCAIDTTTCAACAHAALRAQGGCEPARSCMQDAFARRIDRFFRSHPALANAHLGHPYFEVRAIAACYADLFLLTPLLNDEDETVRLQVALRVSQRLLQRMLRDPHREVRGDPDWRVRWEVACRAQHKTLQRLLTDPEPDVRERAGASAHEHAAEHGHQRAARGLRPLQAGERQHV